jgi:hypothetical protein
VNDGAAVLSWKMNGAAAGTNTVCAPTLVKSGLLSQRRFDLMSVSLTRRRERVNEQREPRNSCTSLTYVQRGSTVGEAVKKGAPRATKRHGDPTVKQHPPRGETPVTPALRAACAGPVSGPNRAHLLLRLRLNVQWEGMGVDYA